MAIHRLNHAVLYVRDVERSVAFYRDVLGFDADRRDGRAARRGLPARAGLDQRPRPRPVRDRRRRPAPSPAGRSTVGLYHLAWEVDTLRDLETLAGKLAEAGALVGSSDHSTTKSLYGHDPDGLEFEIAWIVPADRLDDAALAGRSRIRPLDLPARSRATAPTPRAASASAASRPPAERS